MVKSESKNKIGLELKLVDAVPIYGLYTASFKEINYSQIIGYSIYQNAACYLIGHILLISIGL